MGNCKEDVHEEVVGDDVDLLVELLQAGLRSLPFHRVVGSVSLHQVEGLKKTDLNTDLIVF